MITSGRFSRNDSCRENGPYKSEFNITSQIQRYNYEYNNKNNNMNNYNIDNKRKNII